MDDQRLASLRQTKLRALVSGRWPGAGPASGGPFPGGAVLSDEARAWVLVDDGSTRVLGPALAWAAKQGLKQLDVLVEGLGPAGVLARRASGFEHPPAVWSIRGRELHAGLPAPFELPPGPPPAVAPLAEVLRQHGIDPVVDGGVLVGEVLGLEVARAVEEGNEWRLAVGVGRFDRRAREELTQARWGGPAPDVGAALDEVVTLVRTWRAPDLPAHPANRLARDRWLRSVLIDRPELIGLQQLHPLASPLPRASLFEPSAPAVGADAQGATVVVVCSAGADLDLVAEAADCRLLALTQGWSSPARLVLAMPAAHDHPAIRKLAAQLREPAEVVIVPDDWAAVAP